MLDNLIKIAQMVGWAPVALLLALAIVVGLFVFRERDVTRLARIQYLEEKLKDCRAETPTAVVNRLRETLKTNDEEMAQLKQKEEQAAQNYQRKLEQINEAKTRAEARLVTLEQLRQDKEQADAASAIHFEELQNERDAALLQAAALRGQLVRAANNLNELAGPHSGRFDDRIAEALLFPDPDENVVYILVRTGYPKQDREAEKQMIYLKRLEEVRQTGGIVVKVYRDGLSKMSVSVLSLEQEPAGWLETPDRHWYSNDYNKTLLAILEFADVRWLPTNGESFLRACIEIHRVRFQGVSPIDPGLAYMRVELLADKVTVRHRAAGIVDNIK